jgi:sirohydrochlorin cobaltochelatase
MTRATDVAAVDPRRGLILFAHGARDVRWAEPFERLRDRVAARIGDARVILAFLELMDPGLDAAVDALVADGCTALAIVPIFFGQGSHLRRDLPLLVDQIRERLPTITISIADAAGEDGAVLEAIADYCVRSSIAT